MSRTAVIGIGFNGCVHKPSLKCASDRANHSRNETISKTANVDEILDEIKYMKLIDEIDPEHKYHLAQGEECEIENSNENRMALELCSKNGSTFGNNVIQFLNHESMREDARIILEKGIQEATIAQLKGYRPKNVADLKEYAEVLYAMMVMKNGGPDLNQWSKNKYTEESLLSFLKKSRTLFEGIIHFQKHGIVLNDVKPANIVFDGENFNFIDFGMTQRVREIKESAASSDYAFSIIHWNFPWEMYFLDRNNFDNLEYFQINDKISAQMNEFFRQSKEKLEDKKKKHMQDFNNFMTDCKKIRYEDYVDKCLRTIDSFGLGLSMLAWLRSVDSQFHDRALFKSLEQLYEDMTCQNLFERMTIDNASTELIKLLKPKSKFTDVPTRQQLREQNKIGSRMKTDDDWNELGDYVDSPKSSSPKSSLTKKSTLKKTKKPKKNKPTSQKKSFTHTKKSRK
jgi:hypothetical protein